MSWATLHQIVKANRAEAERAEAQPPEDCPVDGALLDIRADGVRNCPYGNYRWENGTGTVLGAR